MQAWTTWGRACNELSVSRADCASENMSAAVLLDPAIPAAEVRSPASAVRKLRTSYTASAVEATKIETPQVTKIIPLIFRPIDSSRRVCMSAPVVLGRVVDHAGQ